jgi:hypothetical protein
LLLLVSQDSRFERVGRGEGSFDSSRIFAQQVLLLMRNLMRMYPVESAAGLNRILAKIENVFLLDDPPSAAEAAAAADAAAARVGIRLSGAAGMDDGSGMRGSLEVTADILDVELLRTL